MIDLPFVDFLAYKTSLGEPWKGGSLILKNHSSGEIVWEGTGEKAEKISQYS